MSVTEAGPKKLAARFSKSKFLQNYLNDLPGGGIFIETKKLFGLGETVEVVFDISDSLDAVNILGTVQWHRRPKTWQPDLPSGIGIGFDTQSQAQRDYLVNYCFGTTREKRWSGPRVVCDFPVRFFWNEVWCYGRAANMGRGGLCVLSDETVPAGTVIEMSMKPTGGTGHVQSNVEVVRSVDGPGRAQLGIAFKERLPRLERAVDLLIRDNAAE